MSRKPKKPEPTNAERIATFRKPTPGERRALDQAMESAEQRPVRVAVKIEVNPDKSVSVWPVHNDGAGFGDHIAGTFGTGSHSYVDAAISRLEQVLRTRGETYATKTHLNAALALMGAIEPANELEAALGEQIVSTHALSMDLMSKAKHSETMDKLQAYTNLATKVSRTMAAHVETLARLRSGGKQTHEIRYVYVNGNAVVGDGAKAVFAGPGGGVRVGNSGQPHAPDAIACFAAAGSLSMPGEDPAWHAMPIASGSRTEAMPDARGSEGIGRSDREGERPLHMRALDEGAGGCPGPGAGGDEGVEAAR